MTWVLYTLLVMLLGILYRLIRGPLLEDRLLALNVVAVLIILIMSLHSMIYGRSFYLDIALVYALLSFSEIIAIVKFSHIAPSDVYTKKDQSEKKQTEDL